MRRVKLAALLLLALSPGSLPRQEEAPSLSAKSQKEQNVFSFLAARPIDPKGRAALEAAWTYVGPDLAHGVGIWLKTPQPPDGAQPPATITMPGGFTFQLEPHYLYVRQKDSTEIEPWACFALPRGYSGSTQSVDISVKDAAGNSAAWTVVDLPPSRRLEGTRPSTLDMPKAGVQLKAGAWWLAPTPGYYFRHAHVAVETQGTPRPPHRWEITLDRALQEWQPAEGQPEKIGWFPELKKGESGISWPVVAFYPEDQTMMRLDGRVIEFDSVDETVTFRDLPVVKDRPLFESEQSAFLSLRKPRSARTPSGITVTLPAQNSDGAPKDSGRGGDLSFRLSVPTEAASPPRSPLSRRWKGRPIRIFLQGVGAPYSCDPWRSPTAERDVTVKFTGRLPDRIPALTFRIRHRVDLRSFPYSLDAKIQPRLPDEFWKRMGNKSGKAPWEEGKEQK